MDVALHKPTRTVTKDSRQGGKVNPSLREARRKSVAEVVQHKRE